MARNTSWQKCLRAAALIAATTLLAAGNAASQSTGFIDVTQSPYNVTCDVTSKADENLAAIQSAIDEASNRGGSDIAGNMFLGMGSAKKAISVCSNTTTKYDATDEENNQYASGSVQTRTCQ